jgi:hypothetical protein
MGEHPPVRGIHDTERQTDFSFGAPLGECVLRPGEPRRRPPARRLASRTRVIDRHGFNRAVYLLTMYEQDVNGDLGAGTRTAKPSPAAGRSQQPPAMLVFKATRPEQSQPADAEGNGGNKDMARWHRPQRLEHVSMCLVSEQVPTTTAPRQVPTATGRSDTLGSGQARCRKQPYPEASVPDSLQKLREPGAHCDQDPQQANAGRGDTKCRPVLGSGGRYPRQPDQQVPTRARCRQRPATRLGGTQPSVGSRSKQLVRCRSRPLKARCRSRPLKIGGKATSLVPTGEIPVPEQATATGAPHCSVPTEARAGLKNAPSASIVAASDHTDPVSKARHKPGALSGPQVRCPSLPASLVPSTA